MCACVSPIDVKAKNNRRKSSGLWTKTMEGQDQSAWRKGKKNHTTTNEGQTTQHIFAIGRPTAVSGSNSLSSLCRHLAGFKESHATSPSFSPDPPPLRPDLPVSTWRRHYLHSLPGTLASHPPPGTFSQTCTPPLFGCSAVGMYSPGGVQRQWSCRDKRVSFSHDVPLSVEADSRVVRPLTAETAGD